MPTNLLVLCTAVGALAAAVLMNWAIRKSKQFKREGRDIERALVGMPVFVGLLMLAAALGAVEWDRSHDLANQAVGVLLLGMLVGALAANLDGSGIGPGDDDQDTGLGGVDGDSGDGE